MSLAAIQNPFIKNIVVHPGVLYELDLNGGVAVYLEVHNQDPSTPVMMRVQQQDPITLDTDTPNWVFLPNALHISEVSFFTSSGAGDVDMLIVAGVV